MVLASILAMLHDTIMYCLLFRKHGLWDKKDLVKLNIGMLSCLVQDFRVRK